MSREKDRGMDDGKEEKVGAEIEGDAGDSKNFGVGGAQEDDIASHVSDIKSRAVTDARRRSEKNRRATGTDKPLRTAAGQSWHSIQGVGVWFRSRSRRVQLAVIGVCTLLLVSAGLIIFGFQPVHYPTSEGDVVPYDGRSPKMPVEGNQRVLVTMPKPALGQLVEIRHMTANQQREYVRSLEDETRALKKSLKKKGIHLKDVRTFTKVWNGFAATVSQAGIAELAEAGVHAQPVRRFFPAYSEPIQVRGRAMVKDPMIRKQDQDVGANKKTGFTTRSNRSLPARKTVAKTTKKQVNKKLPTLAVLAGADSASKNDPFLQMFSAPNRRIMPIKVAHLRLVGGLQSKGKSEVYGTTDELIAGLEHAVDPNRDNSTGDHVQIALIAVNSPYAAFARSPEAFAVHSATRLGTLVITAAGNEGIGSGRVGTIGSPGAVDAALTVGALKSPRSIITAPLSVGNARIDGAVVLGGKLPSNQRLRTAKPNHFDFTLTGRVAIIRAGVNPSAQADKAAAAGASAIIIAQPRRNWPLPMMPAGRIKVPTVGVTASGAKALLKTDANAEVVFGKNVEFLFDSTPQAVLGSSPFSSEGPTFSGSDKPDLLARGADEFRVGKNQRVVIGGSAVAAAQITKMAYKFAVMRPKSEPLELKRVVLGAAKSGVHRNFITVAQSQRHRPAQTKVKAASPPIGSLSLMRDKQKRIVGAQFNLGSFKRGDPLGSGTQILVPERLHFELINSKGKVVNRLTPKLGASDLLPGEYGYRLSGRVAKQLKKGNYYFLATAVGADGRDVFRQQSPKFKIKEPKT